MTPRSRTGQVGSTSLKDIQAPVADALARVHDEMWRIVAIDSEFFRGVNEHLMLMKGKMVRPTLLLLASETDGALLKHQTISVLSPAIAGLPLG